MEALRVGSKGPLVEQWEIFLRGLDLLGEKEVDNQYTEATAEGTRRFQERFRIGAKFDGVAGNQTLGYAMAHLGFQVVELASEDFPKKPADAVALNFEGRQKLLGNIAFAPAPVAGNPEGIKITNDWQKQHLGSVKIPQLQGIYGAPPSGTISFNKAVIPQLVRFFVALEKEGLVNRIVGWGGSFAPRFIRGSKTTLSQHAHASAFDINVPWNGLGARPALIGEQGSVRELVLTAYRHGFYWGGWYAGRKDGMHFEVFKVMP
jgi:hypothetical protein